MNGAVYVVHVDDDRAKIGMTGRPYRRFKR